MLEGLVEYGFPLKAGRKVKFTIDENPSTGFQWIHDPSLTEGAFTVDSRYFSGKSSDSMMMGGPSGKRHFTLTSGEGEQGTFFFCATRS